MYDLVIIGSGPAGLSAAVYAKRACLDVVVLEKEPMGGGQMIYTQEVDNYLGLPETNGFDLAQKFEQHAKALEVPFISDEVDNVEKNTDGTWKITGASGTVYETKTVLLATGAGHRKLGVPGEETLAGAGVSYCATCDGAFFRNKTVAVVGGGDVALEDALYLAAGCEKVYLIHRRQELRGTKVLQEQVANEPKITFLPDTVVKEICGEQMVDHLVIANTGTGEEKELPVSGIFIAVGMNPQTDAVASVLDLDHGYVRAGEDGVTEAGRGLFVWVIPCQTALVVRVPRSRRLYSRTLPHRRQGQESHAQSLPESETAFCFPRKVPLRTIFHRLRNLREDPLPHQIRFRARRARVCTADS